LYLLIFFPVNVTKMDKEAIKHFDSQREKQFLLDARKQGFAGFSAITDPSLMPPGHGRTTTLFGAQLGGSGPSTGGGGGIGMGSMQMPPQQQQMPPLYGVRVSGTSAALENRFPVRMDFLFGILAMKFYIVFSLACSTFIKKREMSW
jgi:hypothetical protein